jgi:hypothetical protein
MTRASQKVKGLKKTLLLQKYKNEANITFQRNTHRLQRTGFGISQVFSFCQKKVFWLPF